MCTSELPRSDCDYATQTDPADLPGDAQPTKWVEQRSDIRSIEVTFSADVMATANDLELTNLGVNAPAETDQQIVLREDQVAVDGNQITLTFAPYELPDGVYRLEVLPSVTDMLGHPLDGNGDGTGGDSYVRQGDADNKFYKMSGEFNGDGGVTIFDFPTFAYWFGKPVPTAPAYVDLFPDAGVSIFDFPIFAANFGKSPVFPTGLQPRAARVDALLDSEFDAAAPLPQEFDLQPHTAWEEDDAQVDDAQVDDALALAVMTHWRRDRWATAIAGVDSRARLQRFPLRGTNGQDDLLKDESRRPIRGRLGNPLMIDQSWS